MAMRPMSTMKFNGKGTVQIRKREAAIIPHRDQLALNMKPMAEREVMPAMPRIAAEPTIRLVVVADWVP